MRGHLSEVLVVLLASGQVLLALPEGDGEGDLPLSTLAAIVIVAVLGFIDVAAVRRLRNWRRSEFTLAMVAFTGVAVLGVLWGVGIAIALSLLNFIRRAWRPHDAVLGRVDNLKGYHDTERYPDARRVPGLVLYRFDAPLFFANADYFRERVRALARSGDATWIVVAAEPITDIDATAGETLPRLNDELDAAGIELAFAELKDPVRDRLRRYGIHDAIGDHRFFPTLGVAVATYLHVRRASTGSTGRIVNPAITPTPATDVDAGPSLRPAHEVTVTRRPTGSSAAGAPGDARHLFRPRNPEVAGEGRSAHTHGPRETIGGGR